MVIELILLAAGAALAARQTPTEVHDVRVRQRFEPPRPWVPAWNRTLLREWREYLRHLPDDPARCKACGRLPQVCRVTSWSLADPDHCFNVAARALRAARRRRRDLTP